MPPYPCIVSSIIAEFSRMPSRKMKSPHAQTCTGASSRQSSWLLQLHYLQNIVGGPCQVLAAAIAVYHKLPFQQIAAPGADGVFVSASENCHFPHRAGPAVGGSCPSGAVFMLLRGQRQPSAPGAFEIPHGVPACQSCTKESSQRLLIQIFHGDFSFAVKIHINSNNTAQALP